MLKRVAHGHGSSARQYNGAPEVTPARESPREGATRNMPNVARRPHGIHAKTASYAPMPTSPAYAVSHARNQPPRDRATPCAACTSPAVSSSVNDITCSPTVQRPAPLLRHGCASWYARYGRHTPYVCYAPPRGNVAHTTPRRASKTPPRAVVHGTPRLSCQTVCSSPLNSML